MLGRVMHIVATCTDRKSVTPPEELCLRNTPRLPSSAPNVDAWLEVREHAEAREIRAENLYRGELWSATLALRNAATETGRDVRLWVASAGYGLVDAGSLVKPYAATFSPNQRDSIPRSGRQPRGVSDVRGWWAALTRRGDGPSIAGLASRFVDDEMLIVMSAAYLEACHDDVVAAGRAHPTAVLVSAGAGPEHAAWAPAFDARCQGRGRPVAGTRTSLNVRVATELIGRVGSRPLTRNLAHALTEDLMAGLPANPTYDRDPATDEEVADFCRQVLLADPKASHTSTLRRFRDEERRACEQKRFAAIFRAVKTGLASQEVPA